MWKLLAFISSRNKNTNEIGTIKKKKKIINESNELKIFEKLNRFVVNILEIIIKYEDSCNYEGCRYISLWFINHLLKMIYITNTISTWK